MYLQEDTFSADAFSGYSLEYPMMTLSLELQQNYSQISGNEYKTVWKEQEKAVELFMKTTYHVLRCFV